MMRYKIIALVVLILGFASGASAATLSVSPASGTYASGGTFTVNVLLNTTGAQIDGVDLRYLNFNPSVLQVVDANVNQSGVQVTPGNLMPSTLTNTVDNTSGRITFSQIVAGGQHYQGSGTLLSITFSAVSGGTATLSFDSVSGRTTDSNVASNGADVLTSASGATFTISGSVVNPPVPPPVASPTPTPTPNTPATGANTGSGGAVGGANTATTSGNIGAQLGGIPGINLYRTIYMGSRGTDVTTLQNYLIATGYLNAGSNSGYFGALTRAAVQKFQCAKMQICTGTEGTTGYGLVGARTRTVLAGGVAPSGSGTTAGFALTRTVYFGARGSDITSLQNYLISKGYLNAGSNSGYFGALTRTAVQRFQCEKMQICSGTESTTGYGLVGARTRAMMSSN